MFRYTAFILPLFILLGCSSKQEDIPPPPEHDITEVYIPKNQNKYQNEIFDLVNIPQDITYFTKNMNDKKELYEVQKRLEKNYFSIWNIERPTESIESAMWPFRVYKAGDSYGENMRLLPEAFFEEMKQNANFDSYATLNLRAVTTKECSMRVFPTNRPLLKDPALSGEGFPFDYLQNTTVHANEPLFISHYSKDGEWAYVLTSYASGWIKTDRFAILDKRYTDKWQNAVKIVVTKENEPIYDDEGAYMYKSKIGMMFALIDESEKSYTVLSVSSYKNSKPLFIRSKISKEAASKEILKLNARNIDLITEEVSKTNYGWGGLYGQRDCSSMLRDMFIPFGIWMPRNSSQQSIIGEVLSLDGLNDEDKIRIIKEKGIPFETLLYKKGHIVLYVGTYNDDIIIFHNTWGIKTKKNGFEGRVLIGKAIFSSLKLGRYQELYDEESEILRNLVSMNIFTR